MSIIRKASQRGIISLVLFAVLVLLRVIWPEWPWPYFAAALGLLAVGLTALGEQRRAFGDDYDSQSEMNAPGKVSARTQGSILMACAIALVVFGGIIPVLALPERDDLVRTGAQNEEVTFADAKGKQRLNPNVLKAKFAQMQAQIEAVENRPLDDWLLVRNCGLTGGCLCPSGYQAVPDSGGWNLNDRTTGATIRLCAQMRRR